MKETIHFDAPEFYQFGVVAKVEGPDGKPILVSVEGERDAQYGDLHLSTYQQFRDAFPDGEMPEESDTFVWRYNSWFAVYDDGEVMGDPMMSLAEAVSYALDLAYGEL